MNNQQLFTRIAMSALIGLNVGAYYVFWPTQDGDARSQAKAQVADEGLTQLVPTPQPAKQAKANDPAPKPASAKVVASLPGAVPLSIPAPPKAPDVSDATVTKLLEHIEREKNLPPLPALPPIPVEGTPKTLPEIDAKSLDPRGRVAAPMKPGGMEGPWLIQVQEAKPGGQTQVIVKHRNGDEFRIGCARFETNSNGSEAVASGNVVCIGAGMTVSCRRLTLPLAASQIVFEDQIILGPTASASTSLRLERMVWEISTTEPTTDLKPGPLGAPK